MRPHESRASTMRHENGRWLYCNGTGHDDFMPLSRYLCDTSDSSTMHQSSKLGCRRRTIPDAKSRRAISGLLANYDFTLSTLLVFSTIFRSSIWASSAVCHANPMDKGEDFCQHRRVEAVKTIQGIMTPPHRGGSGRDFPINPCSAVLVED